MSIEPKLIFDMDGVLIDSENIAMRVMDDWGVKLLGNFGHSVEADYIYNTFPGTSTNKIVEALINNHQLPLDSITKAYNLVSKLTSVSGLSIELAEQVTEETLKSFEDKLMAIPGTVEAVRILSARYGAENKAIATTSPPPRLVKSLDYAKDPLTGLNAGLAQLFPAGNLRFSGYDYDNKYDAFFELNKWSTKGAHIVEDSLSGVQKSKAGRPEVDTIGTVAAKFYLDKQAQAHLLLHANATLVISSMHDLPAADEWIRSGMGVKSRPEFKSAVYLPAGERVGPAPAAPSMG